MALIARSPIRATHSFLVLLTALWLTAPLAAQTDTLPTLDDARALIQAQDYEAAAEILGPITEREPDNAPAWAMLGFALHSAGDYERALEAHLEAAEFESTAPTAMYNAGLAYALMGETDEAFQWLERARATGRVNMTQLDIDPDAESLRDDPRYRQLFPSAEEFADPFAESAEILREWRGAAIGDQFGWIARNIGDVDGDGIADVVTSAPTAGDRAGRVYVYSSGTGELLWTRDGAPGAQLGLGLEAAGDVDADGIPDVAAGAPGAGKAYVYGGRYGAVLLELREPIEGEFFGRRVADLGDLNGDGHADVLVGAPRSDAAGEDAGSVYLYSGADGARLATLTGREPGDRFGAAGAGYQDDQRTMLVIGAPDAGPEDRGRVYVYVDDWSEPAFVIESDSTGSELGGMFVSVVGDVDADGVPDVYASDWSNAAKGRSTGRIYVHSGADGSRILTLTGEAPGDGFGIGPADAGDVNGDGHADLVIGAWQHAGAAPSGGKVYLYSGSDGSVLRAWTGDVPGETFGFDATGLGDVNGDGAVDFLVTSAWSAVEGGRSGRVYIIAGDAER